MIPIEVSLDEKGYCLQKDIGIHSLRHSFATYFAISKPVNQK